MGCTGRPTNRVDWAAFTDGRWRGLSFPLPGRCAFIKWSLSLLRLSSPPRRRVQVRFEVSCYALKPDIKIIAPWREWDLLSRTKLIEYAEKNNIPVPAVSVLGPDDCSTAAPKCSEEAMQPHAPLQ